MRKETVAVLTLFVCVLLITPTLAAAKKFDGKDMHKAGLLGKIIKKILGRVTMKPSNGRETLNNDWVRIVYPKEGYINIHGRGIFPHPSGKTIVIGSLEIKVSASRGAGWVQFFLDGTCIGEDNNRENGCFSIVCDPSLIKDGNPHVISVTGGKGSNDVLCSDKVEDVYVFFI